MSIYLDNAATTQPNAAVLSEMARAERELFYNSAALYAPSLRVKKELARAGEVIRKKLTQAGGGEVVFTSGATEGNNMVLLGKITNKRHHLVVSSGEHSSVYAAAVYLKNSGFDVDFAPLDRDGSIDLRALEGLVRPDTALVVFGMVNSDTGTMQDAAAVVRTVRASNKTTHIHCDAVQAFAKFDFDAVGLGLDSCVISAHKINGPKGIGALWLRSGVRLAPLMFGGTQQNLRPGTENNAAVWSFAKAVETFDTGANYTHIKSLHDRLLTCLPRNCTVNGKNNNPYITSITLSNVMGQTVLNALSAQEIYVGLGSACASAASKNRTLLAMGVTETKTRQVLRISLGVSNTVEEIDIFLQTLRKILENIAKA